MSSKTPNEALGRLDRQAFLQAGKLPLIVVLDNIRSLNNIGSVFRTADAFRLQAIYLCGITATPPHREIARTALGATETITWQYFATTIEALNKLKQENWHIAAIEQAQNKVWLQDFVWPEEQSLAIVFGNEVMGIDEEVINASDSVIEIPQFGTKHSFNIAVSAGIVIWELWKKSGYQL
ncbi:MAG: RNA methyltransferase [Chitinophagales bacterium]|nr:RNA methyltransferase [Chitinophagales bacterium]